jgi:hypothetical protein
MSPEQRKVLEALYRDTDYCVEIAPAPLVLAVDERSEALAEFLRARGSQCAAFITAFNPHGVMLSESENAERMIRLKRTLRDGGFEWIEGEGRARDGRHAELSLLVFDIALEAAHALMRRFEQNAFLWCAAEAVPRLVWTAPA